MHTLPAVLLAGWIMSSAALADIPQPPCQTPPLPPYAAVGAPASVRTWTAATLPDPWVPPDCLRWKTRGFATIVAIAGRIGGITEPGQILQRLVSTAGLRAVLYWSFSRKTWRTLFAAVDTLAGPDKNLKRGNLALDEIRTGRDYFMWQKENSIASGMVLRSRFEHLSSGRIVFEQVNLTVSSILMLKVLAPGEYETAYFLDHEASDVWRYYSLTRFGAAERPLSEAALASVINRSVAIYRYLAGIPTDREPPAAP